MKKKKEPNMKVQWTKFAVVIVLYLLFLLWLQSWLGLIVVPFIYDAYITKKIRWDWWKDLESFPRFIMSWVDALVFALVAVYFINLFFFQNYVIPSSSLEKSLLTGDYLFVSKVSYGPRIPQTPLTMPLTQHTMPFVNVKSYIDWPQWDYRRAPGLGKVELNDIVVFNYPAGDTVFSEPRYQQQDYYRTVYGYGFQILQNSGVQANLDSLSPMMLRQYYQMAYNAGRQYVISNPGEFGDLMWRPADRTDNYVKRCVGLPGQTLQVKNRIIYLDGKPNKEPDNVQYSYYVTFREGVVLDNDFLRDNGITCEDLSNKDDIQREYLVRELSDEGGIKVKGNYLMPLTKATAAVLKSRKDLVKSIRLCTDQMVGEVYPLDARYGWTCDNYGPVWIPKKGESVKLTLKNLPIYERPIRVYEGNDLLVNDKGQILINGKVATSYTFKMDYYWMMGDNRHNSADSRYWGFVPEDHIVGKPIFIWWSSDPDRHNLFTGIRWSRLFRLVDNIK